MLRCAFAVLTLALLTLAPRMASAQDDGGDNAASRASAVKRSTGTGSFLGLTQSATLDGQSAVGSAFGGYDSTRQAGMFEATAEVRLWKGLSLRGGAMYSPDKDRMRPSFGARYQLLSESRHGVDGGLGVFYRPEGLTEPEGEIEAVLSAGSHLGATYLVGNLIYGQDPEANERDGELRIAALHPVGGMFFLGVDGRARFDLGSKPTKQEAKLDAVVGPAATVLVGPMALSVQGGASALRLKDTTKLGAVVLGGVGSSF